MFPSHSLEKALVVIGAIVDKGGSKQMDRLLVADAIGRTPSSSEFKRLLSSSRAYGLTSGTEKADFISPTELGLKIMKPTQPQEALVAKVQACLAVEILGKVYRSFNKNFLIQNFSRTRLNELTKFRASWLTNSLRSSSRTRNIAEFCRTFPGQNTSAWMSQVWLLHL
jgi:hypothetical protein